MQTKIKNKTNETKKQMREDMKISWPQVNVAKAQKVK